MASIMNTPPRRSSRDRRPVDRLTAENDSGFHSIIQEQHEHFQQVTIAPAAPLEEHSYNSNNTKKRRLASIPDNCSFLPTASIIPRRTVQVTLKPWDITRRGPLMATLPRLQNGEVRVRLAECDTVSHVLAAIPLVAFLPQEVSTAPFAAAAAQKQLGANSVSTTCQVEQSPLLLPVLPPPVKNDMNATQEMVVEQQQQSVDIPTTTTKRKYKRKADRPPKKRAPTTTRTKIKPSGNKTKKRRAVRPSNHKASSLLSPREAVDTPGTSTTLHLFATPSKRLGPQVSSSSTRAVSTSQDYPATPKTTTRDSLTLSFQTPASSGSLLLQTPASDCSITTKEGGSLVALTQEFYNRILESGSNQVDLKQMAQQMNVSKRRLYDITHVMEGAGMMTRDSKNGLHFETGPKTKSQKHLEEQARLELSVLEQQEVQVQEYMSHLELLHDENEMAYVTPHTLAPLHDADKDSIFLGIATPRGSTVCQTTNHGFALCPPESTLPQAYLLESQESMRELSLLPKPPLMERCCSDFSYNALNRQSSIGSFHGGKGLLRQSSIGSIGLGRQSSIGSIGNTIGPSCLLRAQTSIGSFSCHDDVATSTNTNTGGSPCLFQGMVISEMPLTALQYHESFGLSLDKSEPPPTIDPKVFPCTAPDYVVPDENQEPFQYPWLKGTPLSQAKFCPNQSSTRLLSDGSQESSLVPTASFHTTGTTTTALSSGMNESLLPRRSRRSLLDDDDDDDVSNDMEATLLHECAAGLVLWND